MAKDDVKDEKKSESLPEKTEEEKKGEVKEATTTVPSPADKEPASAGKNSALKWVLIYIVIGAVIYGAWYYFSVARDTGTSDSQTSSLYQ